MTTRRQFLTGLGATAAVASAPGFINFSQRRLGSSNTLTNTVLEADLETFGSDADPSFLIHYQGDDEREQLESWVDSNAVKKRELENVNLMAISASWEDIGLQQRGYGPASINQISGGVQENDYVDYIDANMSVEVPEPIDELEGSDAWSYDFGWRRTAALMVRTRSWSPTPDGIEGLAFDGDAPEATIPEARDLVRADDDLIDSVDTSELTIAVIDTGVNDGSTFGDRILPESTDFTSDSDPTGIDAVADGDGHGTWVAACMAGSDGFAPDAGILGLKALGDDGGGQTKDIVAAVDKAIEEEADIVCLSLGSPLPSQALADALADARDAGVFCVVAVGNDRFVTVFTNSPADADDGFGVNASNVPESGDRDDTKPAYFGNTAPDPDTGNGPELVAPGMNITAELPSGPSTLSGTSMAAPMVGGGAALLRASEGTDVDETWDRLTATGHPLEHAGETEAEFGLLDVQAAIDDDEPDDDRDEIRSAEAEARDAFNETLSTIL
ncbi:S8 family peptidase [Natronorubrum texcoconense]|uniref:Subtilase family protein n=1 Tax=Natronorubrum texcoconense TaxID=1095776 RepID=A0A1G9H7F8_9EURY|nr:S8 family serine peptidase [Natronorubrum texcoconense]SDL08734.1 Subtilase family protein [Natronorubrum texcoconense]